MALQVYKFSELVSNIATAIQAAASAPLNFSPGSVLRALVEATAGMGLWLQAIVLQLLTLTRAATSRGADLDSWMADFGLARLPATTASGQVAFSRFTPAQQAVVPVGAGVQTGDGTRKFLVILDAGHAAYNAGLGGYVLPPATPSVNVPVQAVAAGTGGNVQAGSITVITTPIPGVDTASNASAFINGIDAESDPAYRARFFLFIASLSRATKAAVGYAVASVRQGLTYTLTENEDYDGATDMGFFYVVADDGSGSPPSDLLDSISVAIEAVRPLGSRFAVFAPIVTTANVAMTITSAAGYAHPAVVVAVSAALAGFLDGLPLGASLPYTQLASVAYGVPGVTNASSILLNGGTADLAIDRKHKVLAGTITLA